MILGQLIKDHRELNRISVRKLASQIGVEHSALFRFERSQPIDTKNWAMIFRWVLGNENGTTNNTKGKKHA